MSRGKSKSSESTFAIGLDTGGTFTDAALLKMFANGDSEVVAKAKSLTTRHDLSVGLKNATKKIIEESGCQAEEVGLVSLSTTLATNAIVEGHGAPAALITIGFSDSDVEQAGLREALGGEPHIAINGGHTPHGEEVTPPDLQQLTKKLKGVVKEGVEGFAVAGFFGVRNPTHELEAKKVIEEKTGLPVTCSHELSAKLNGPKRALTCLLNARLVPLIARLIDSTRAMLKQQKINAPLMVVRGDGALVSAEFARSRPVETILSGPAASLIGAKYLSQIDNAWVCDIGGTTSDIACLQNGKPRLDEQGAKVGAWRTMVEAVAMRTFGIGGDSNIIAEATPKGEATMSVGPSRVIPISLLAKDYPSIHETLDRQLKSKLSNRYDARFAVKRSNVNPTLNGNQKMMFEELGDEPIALEFLFETHRPSSLTRLVNQGLVMVAGPTPTDALHVINAFQKWDKEAADKALRLFGRQYQGTLPKDAVGIAKLIAQKVSHLSAEAILTTALDEDNRTEPVNQIIQDTINNQKNKTKSHVNFSVALNEPLVGLGAAAEHYHPNAAQILETKIVIPEHAEVANAIGAVVGQIQVRAEVTITQPAEGKFLVTNIPNPFASEDKAIKAAQQETKKQVAELARQAGATEDDTQIFLDVQRKCATVESKKILVEAKVTATATGRPPFATTTTQTDRRKQPKTK